MNRKGIFLGLMILSIFTANGLFAFDLWEGLDTNMTMDQLLAKAREVLKVQRPPVQEAGSISIEDDDLKNRFPQSLTKVGLASTLPNLGAIEFAGYPVTNVDLYLSNNRLFAIWVSWNFPTKPLTTSAELLAMVTKQYGKPREVTKERANFRFAYYLWETSEKIIYCQGGIMLVINKQMLR